MRWNKIVKSKHYITDNETVLAHPAIYDVLIYDIETDSLNLDTATAKFTGAYSYKYQKYYIFHPNELDKFQKLVNEHRVTVGFNNYFFDQPILENSTNSMNFNYKICFDCYKVLYDRERKRSNREPIIKWKGKTLGEQLPNRKLRTVAQVLDFPVAKGDIDYRIFQKDSWSREELNEIYKYLFLDVDITRRLFEFYVSYFKTFTEYVDDANINKFNYIRSSTGSFSYSAFCHMAELPFEFEDNPIKKKIRPENDGGFVLEPQVKYAQGTVVYFDFSSLYPFIYFQCNLFSHGSEEPSDWNGDDFFKINGNYKTDRVGKVESVLKDIYYKRATYKRNKDPRELALKIMMNSLYGISGSPIFKSLFDIYTPGDCTAIGRKCLAYAKETFELHGLPVLYADTDSCFVHLPSGMTVDDAQVIADNIVKELQSHMPFPDEGFKFKVDDVFDKIWLHKKKMYIGLNHDGELIIKGHGIKKHDASQLGQLIFKRIKPLILQRKDIKFDKEFINAMIDEEIRRDITLVGQLYNVKNPENYKSITSIQCQIATALGEGTHLLIPNKSLGSIGKSKKYCTEEEAKDLTVSDLILDKVYTELKPFTK